MRNDPYRNFRFLLEIDQIVQAGFSDCSGLGSSIEVVQYREGGDPATVRKLTGKVNYSDIVLKWGVTDSREMYDWHFNAVQGNPKRKNCSVLLMGEDGEEKVRWNFYEAWPSAWKGPDFSGLGKDVAIESLTLVCERIERG
ncbi:MAG: phage tail protein [Clostridiales bacterium]|nr:phage tail protein [Clostridiales bacterium]